MRTARTIRRIALFASFGAVVVAAGPAAAGATQLFPDLRTLPPRDLRLTTADVSVDGSNVVHHVLRFTNTVWNAGPGTLVVHGAIDPDTGAGDAFQRVSDTSGGSAEYPVGQFTYHPVHHHYHFDDWGRYELWTRSAYDAWIAGGRTAPVARMHGTKTTSCVLDEEFVHEFPSTSAWGEFPFEGCSPGADHMLTEGLSPGWGDTYDYTRFEQWVDLGASGLADGDYVLRSVSDPLNKIYESPGKGDAAREGEAANEAITPLSVRGGRLQDVTPPTGTVQINDVDKETASSQVTLRVFGRDDVSGVDAFRVSNDGRTWATFAFTAGPDRQLVPWDLADPRYGGTRAGGLRTVTVEFRDGAGHWGGPVTDSIRLDTCSSSTGAPSRYASAVRGDQPAAFWRLDETCRSTAADELGRNSGTYMGTPRRGVRGLLPAEPGETAVTFGGGGDGVLVTPAGSLSLSRSFTLEAWIRPSRVPGPGRRASLISKPGAYSLGLAAGRLELTVTQAGVGHRVRAPAATTLRAGRIYHVAATYDGHRMRLYVRGHAAASRTLTRRVTATTSALYLARGDSRSQSFAGTLDEVAVYPVALTAARLRAHLQAGLPTDTLAPPSNLRARPASATRIALTWADDASRETGLTLERSTSSRFWNPTVLHLPPYGTSQLDRGLRPGTRFWYRIRSVRGHRHSVWSHPDSARTPPRSRR